MVQETAAVAASPFLPALKDGASRRVSQWSARRAMPRAGNGERPADV